MKRTLRNCVQDGSETGEAAVRMDFPDKITIAVHGESVFEILVHCQADIDLSKIIEAAIDLQRQRGVAV